MMSKKAVMAIFLASIAIVTIMSVSERVSFVRAAEDAIVPELDSNEVEKVTKGGDDAEPPADSPPPPPEADSPSPPPEAEEGTPSPPEKVMDDYAENDAPSSPAHLDSPPPPHHHANAFETNCITLRAYSVAIADEVEEVSDNSLSFLRPVMERLAMAKHTEDCVDMLDEELTKLHSQSIAHGMLEQFKHSMEEGKGIVIWDKIPGKPGQRVFIDATRVGLNSELPLLTHLSVSPHLFIEAAKRIHAQNHLNINGISDDDKDLHYTEDDLKKLFGSGHPKWGGDAI